MALYSSGQSGFDGRNSRAYDLLAGSTPQFGQEAKAFRRRSEEEDNNAEMPVQAAAGAFSNEGTAALFGDPMQQQRNYSKFANSALENMSAVEAERRRAAAEASAAGQRAAAASQANTTGLVAAGVGAVGSIVGGILI